MVASRSRRSRPVGLIERRRRLDEPEERFVVDARRPLAIAMRRSPSPVTGGAIGDGRGIEGIILS
jgi:hypothetical protein